MEQGKKLFSAMIAGLLLMVTIPQTAQAQGAGNALNFDGTDDNIQIPNNSSLNFGTNQSFTIEMWTKWETSADHRAMYRSAGAGKRWLLERRDENVARFEVHDGSSGINVESTTNLNDGQFHHIVGVRGSSGVITLYVDGNSEGNPSGEYAGPVSNTEDYFIASRTGTGAHFKGIIDEVRIWNVARTEAEIRANMCKKLTGSETGLVGYWRLDESSGTSCTDSSPNTNAGTMHNMDDADHVWSGAALGDASAYDYDGTVVSDFSASLSHTDGDDITATGDDGTVTGIQVYRVDATSMRTDATKPTGWTMDPLRYWGVFAVGTSPTYTVAYDYGGHPGTDQEGEGDPEVSLPRQPC